jgi:hypothetical protein
MTIHLLPAVDEALLCGWDSLLLLDALLYPRDLWLLLVWCVGKGKGKGWACLVLGFDVELDFLTGECAYSVGLLASVPSLGVSGSRT